MPERRCAGCGRVAPKTDLVRLALEVPRHPEPIASGGRHEATGSRPARGQKAARRVVIDPRGVLPGRGGYLCLGDRPDTPQPACLERAMRRGGLSRAFRTPVTMDPDFVESTC